MPPREHTLRPKHIILPNKNQIESSTSPLILYPRIANLTDYNQLMIFDSGAHPPYSMHADPAIPGYGATHFPCISGAAYSLATLNNPLFLTVVNTRSNKNYSLISNLLTNMHYHHHNIMLYLLPWNLSTILCYT
jgi:hypothetical protein